MARIGELEVGQDLKFERRWWKFERTGWILLALVLLFAILGYLGPGPLTKHVAGTRGGPLWLEYHRYERYHAPVDLRVHIGAVAARGKELQLWIDREYVDAVSMEDVEPQPESVELKNERFVYTFKVSETPRTAKILFQFKPNKFGKTPGRLGIVDGPEVRFTHLFYP
ncbi:MAG: hypothetical protein L0Y58_19855 [Verrucomicrobia subdivision 3 bacterium]|nr:hypothetical protein [Limisphaerales bacterium]